MQGKKRYIKLTKKERVRLENGRKTGKKATFRQRCHYILLSDQGKSIGQIGDIYRTSRQAIAGWFDRYNASGIGGLHTAKGKGRPPIIRIDNEAEVKKVEDLVEKNPQNLKRVLTQIEKQLGKKMSKKTLQRLLKKKSGDGSDSGKSAPTSPTRQNTNPNAGF